MELAANFKIRIFQRASCCLQNWCWFQKLLGNKLAQNRCLTRQEEMSDFAFLFSRARQILNFCFAAYQNRPVEIGLQ